MNQARHRRVKGSVASGVAVLIAVFLAAVATPSTLPTIWRDRSQPQLDVQLEVGSSMPVLATSDLGSNAGQLPLPAVGSFAMEADLGGRLAQRSPDEVRGIGSIAKTMTALAVLEAHPLGSDDDGPLITFTQADVDDYLAALAGDATTIPVSVGKQLSQRDLLLALMLHSAANIASSLGRWVSGSPAAFVELLNRKAQALGMIHTHFDDATGLSSRTVSTASDLLLLGRAALRNSALAEIVSTASATMADGIPLWNTDTLLSSEPGWLGIKTGHTLAAGFCLLFAVRRTPSGGSVPVTVVGAVLGQKGSADAFGAARAAADAALARYASPASLRPVVSGVARSAWGAQVPVRLGIMHLGTETLRSGAEVALLGIPLRPGPLLRAGDTVGILEGSVDGHLVVWWDIVAGGDISAPPLQWRLAHV